MINIDKDRTYKKLVDSILENKDFKQIENIKHHGTSRMIHSLRVSYYSYKIARFCKLDYDQVARAGLLHDFYLDRTVDYKKTKDKFLLFTTRHPMTAIKNSKKYFELTEKEEDMIKAHMFPIDIHIPKYAESWIINTVDKVVSFYEFFHKFKYQISYATNIYMLFIMNIMK